MNHENIYTRHINRDELVGLVAGFIRYNNDPCVVNTKERGFKIQQLENEDRFSIEVFDDTVDENSIHMSSISLARYILTECGGKAAVIKSGVNTMAI